MSTSICSRPALRPLTTLTMIFTTATLSGCYGPVGPSYPAGCDEVTTGAAPDGFPTVWYRDADGDGYGDPEDIKEACLVAPEGYVINRSDCDDTTAQVSPGNREVPDNGLDDTCDGSVDGRIVAISASSRIGHAIRDDGTFWVWGADLWGLYSYGYIAPLPLQIALPARPAALHGSLFMMTDGTVWQGYGTPINEATITGSSVHIPGLNRIVEVASSFYESLALDEDGIVYTWEPTTSLTEVDGVPTSDSDPHAVEEIGPASAIAAGREFSLVIDAEGQLWSWGYNYYGQLGDGTTSTRETPQPAPGLTGLVAVSGGVTHALAVREDGRILAWGDNSTGQFGDGTTTSSPDPIEVPSLEDVVAVSAAEHHSLALDAHGNVWQWGVDLSDVSGQTLHQAPALVSALSDIIEVSADVDFNLALRADGLVFAWGQNDAYQLGDGTATHNATPDQVRNIP